MAAVAEEIKLLVEEIKRLGERDPATNNVVVKFGTLFHDDRCLQLFEALVGTLRAAKKRRILTYDGELLLQGVHDNVDVILMNDVVE